MKNYLALLFVLALPSFAQVTSPESGVRVRDLTGGSTVLPQEMNFLGSARTYYVTTTGNDANDCKSLPKACLTIEGARLKVPKRLNGSVKILVGPGTFAGARFQGMDIDQTPGASTYFLVQGTMANFAPTTGTATGTATSGTVGSGNTYGTLVDSGQAWTTDNLRGKFVEITAGTGVGLTRMIASNTATTITIAGRWVAAPNGTSVYAIRDWATSITTSPASSAGAWHGPFAGTTSAQIVKPADPPDSDNTAANLFGLVFASNSRTPSRVAFGVDRIKFTGGSLAFGGVACISTDCVVTRSRFEISSVEFGQSACIGGAHCSWIQNSVAPPAATIAFVVNNDGAVESNAYLVQNVVDGGDGFLAADGNIHSFFNSIRGSAYAVYWLGPNPDSRVWFNQIDCQGAGGFGFSTRDWPWTGRAVGSLVVQASSISNCDTVFAIKSPFNLHLTSDNTGSGNTTGIDVTEGGSVRITSTYALSATTDIVIEGASYTLAQLRALTPKAIAGLNYNSKVFEP